MLMGVNITNCLECGAFVRIGDKCTTCHPEVLEAAMRVMPQATPQTKPQPTKPPADPNTPHGDRTRYTTPQNERDKILMEHMAESIPSVVAVAAFLIKQARWDVYVENIITFGSPDDGDVHIRKVGTDEPWRRIEVKWHPTYTWDRLKSCPYIIVDKVDNFDNMPEMPFRYFVFANDFKRAFVMNPQDHRSSFITDRVNNKNWGGEVNVYLLDRNKWNEVPIEGDNT